MPGAAAGVMYLKCVTCKAVMVVIISGMSHFTPHVPLNAIIVTCEGLLRACKVCHLLHSSVSGDVAVGGNCLNAAAQRTCLLLLHTLSPSQACCILGRWNCFVFAPVCSY